MYNSLKQDRRLFFILLTLLLLSIITSCGGSGGSSSGKGETGIRVSTIAGGGSDSTSTDPTKIDLGEVRSILPINENRILILSENGDRIKVLETLNGKSTISNFPFDPDPEVTIESVIYDETSKKLIYGGWSSLPIAKISSVDPAGGASLLLAGGEQGDKDATLGTDAMMWGINSIVIDYEAGILYFIDLSARKVKTMELSGNHAIKTIAGSGDQSNLDSTQGSLATFNIPSDLLLMPDKKLLLVEQNGYAVRQINLSDPNYAVTTIAGKKDINGARIGGNLDAAEATQATFELPSSLARSKSGNVYVGDRSLSRVRRIIYKEGKYGAVSTVAGGGSGSGSDTTADENGHHDATKASFDFIQRMSFYNDVLYIADRENKKIRKIEFLDGAP